MNSYGLKGSKSWHVNESKDVKGLQLKEAVLQYLLKN